MVSTHPSQPNCKCCKALVARDPYHSINFLCTTPSMWVYLAGLRRMVIVLDPSGRLVYIPSHSTVRTCSSLMKLVAGMCEGSTDEQADKIFYPRHNSSNRAPSHSVVLGGQNSNTCKAGRSMGLQSSTLSDTSSWFPGLSTDVRSNPNRALRDRSSTS